MANALKIKEAAARGRATSIIQAKEKYRKNIKHCPNCTAELPYEKRRNKFCSRACATSFYNISKSPYKEEGKKCAQCSYLIRKNVYNKFCSRNCRKEFNYTTFIENWKQGKESGVGSNGNVLSHLRKYLLNLKGNKCWICGWKEINPYTNKVPLEIDHIDGNCLNNSECNLRVLCPNCHSLTPTYRALNKNSGRGHRRKDPIV